LGQGQAMANVTVILSEVQEGAGMKELSDYVELVTKV